VKFNIPKNYFDPKNKEISADGFQRKYCKNILIGDNIFTG